MGGIFETSLSLDAAVCTDTPGLFRRLRHRGGSGSVDSNDECALVLNLTTAHQIKGHLGGREITNFPRLGSITLIPPGCKAAVQIWGESCVLQMRILWAEMLIWLYEDFAADPASVDLSPACLVEDPALARLVYAAALARDDKVELTARSVAAYLFSKYQRKAPSHLPVRGGLSPNQLRRVREIVDEQLTRPLHLPELADGIGISLFHFAREFSRSTGCTPHQYIIGRRLDRAATLLACTDLSVADVARRAGFAHASHLARHLHRHTGLTPEKFRSRLLP
ncbi:helix-turn-helix domain-containing protein [Paraburkholderia sp. 5N]|uniref:Helix-turn-helix domain-containing protein n=2 Tax=Paraburkholderia elongata TaxID=2675747 RepID=A0A972NM81_9BURK|nr:helix-turn-helix domain-containing protein [Paraburkholderia elongata]